jgi:cytochrome P450
MTSSASSAVPVDELDLPEFDVRGAEFTSDPLGVVKRARTIGPLARSHRGTEVLTYDLISRILLDERFDTAGHEHYRKLGAPDAVLRFVDNGLLLTMERPHHDRVRRILTRAFTIRKIDQQRALMQEVGGRLLTGFIDEGGCEFVGEFSDAYPMEALCRLIGVPAEDIATFSHDAHTLHLLGAVPMGPGFPALEEAYESLERYVLGLLEQRRDTPADDFISALIEAQEIEGKLSESEVVGNLVNLLFAGAGTTKMQLASAVRAFVEFGVWEELAATPELIPDALEEVLRFYPVTQFVVRIPLEDAVLGNVLFPKGRRVLLNLMAASRDGEHFPDPDRFDITRDVRHSHLPFGWGVHHCIGHALARTSMIEALRLLTSQLTDVAVTSRTVEAPPSAMLSGPDQLYITFTRRPSA